MYVLGHFVKCETAFTDREELIRWIEDVGPDCMTVHYELDVEIITNKSNELPSLEGGSEFSKRLKSGELEIIEETEDEIVGGSRVGG